MFNTIPLCIVCLFSLFGLFSFAHAETLVGMIPGEADVSSSGAATYDIAIDVPPGINGLQPNLALSYNSQQGNGPLGLGWKLSGISQITRCAANIAQDGFIKAVDFNNDRFCLDGQKLKVVSGAYGAIGAEYRPESSPNTRVYAMSGLVGAPDYWKVVFSNGRIAHFGSTSNSRLLANGTHAGKTVTWGVGSLSDSSNNQINYAYINDQANGNLQVSSISYNAFQVNLIYENRSDVSTRYQAGELSRITQRLSKITMGAANYHFNFTNENFTNTSILSDITYCTGLECYPKKIFKYESKSLANVSGFVVGKAGNSIGNWGDDRKYLPMDLNGDGLKDITEVFKNGTQTAATTWISDGVGGFMLTVNGVYIGNWGEDRQYLPFDVNGDGLTDITEIYKNGLKADATIWISNGAGGFASGKMGTNIGNWGEDRKYLSMDLNGSGLKDITEIFKNGTQTAATTWISNGAGEFALTGNGVYIGNWGEDRKYLPFDVNGDGLTDITEIYKNGLKTEATTWISDGTGRFVGGVGGTQIGNWGDDRKYLPMDLNGDGLKDITEIFKNGTQAAATTWISDGAGGFVLGGNGVYIGNWGEDRKYLPFDVNGDALTDIIEVFENGTQAAATTWINDGTGGFVGGVGGIQIGNWGSDRKYLPFDVDGDGLADITEIYKNGTKTEATTWLSTGDQKVNKLISVHDDLIKRASFEYDVVNVFSGAEQVPLSPIQEHQLLVSKLLKPDGLGGENSTSYHYEGKRAHLQGLGDLGFEKITRTDDTTGMVTTTTYSQNWQQRTVGRPVDVRTSLNGVELSRTLTVYNTLQKDGLFFSYPSVSTSISRDLNNALLNVRAEEQNVYLYGDHYSYLLGQAISCVADGEVAMGSVPLPCGSLNGLQQKTTTNHQYYAEGYVANHPPMLSRQTVIAEVYGGALPFGQSSQQTRTQAFDYDTTTGLLKTAIVEPDNSALRLTTQYAYNARGQQTSVTTSGADIATNTAQSSYSNAAPYNLLSSTNALGQTESYQYTDSRFAWQPTQITAINGVTTQLTYDSMGRNATQTRQNQTTTWSRAWCESCDGVAGAKYKVMQSHTHQADSIAYYDQQQRVIETHTAGLREGYVTPVHHTTQYDALGRVVKTSLPYYEGDTPLYRINQYDALDRVVKETQPNGNVRVQTFNGRTTTIELQTVDGTLQKQDIKNALGQTLQSVDNNGHAVHFQYDAFGNLVRTTDPDNNQITLGYDLLGRKTQMNDPDQGHWTYQYDVNGALKSQTDSNGHTTTHLYDVLGRPVSQTIPEGTSTWTYDNCTNGMGQLCQKTGQGLTESYHYTTAGQLAQSTTTLDGLNYTYQHTYDNTGRLISTQYPTGYTTQTDYHSVLGFANKVRHDDTVIWESKGFNAQGQLENMAMNNDQIQSIKNYQDGEDHVSRLNVISNNRYVASIDYDWTKTGNLRSQMDNTNLVKFGYTYDNLSRLKSTTTTVAGADYGSVSLTYDALGNITQKSDVGNYTYNESQCGYQAGPHAVSSITGKGAYCYDSNGNLLSGDHRLLTYSSFNKPTHIQQNNETTTFSYGPDQQRYKQITTGVIKKTVYYIGNYEKEIRDNHIYHRIQIGDVAIVEQVDDNAESIHYTLRDHLGSLIATVSDTGTIKRLFYDPWGKRLDLPVLEAQPITLFDLASFLTPRGFTGHEHLDNVGLIHMNGRVYDPEIARFVSADPFIPSPLNLQSYNRYAYTLNNPLRYTDPSGFFQEEGGDHAGEAEARANITSGRYNDKTGKWNSKGNSGSNKAAQKKYEEALKIELEKNAQREARDRASRIEHMRQQRIADARAAEKAQKDAALAQQKENARLQKIANDRAVAAQNLIDAAKGVRDGFLSVFKGVGNSFRYLSRSFGLYGETEFHNANVEGHLMDKALSIAINNPKLAFNKTVEASSKIYDNARTNANAYNVSRIVTRTVTGIALAPLGALAGLGDVTYGVEQGRISFENIVRNAAYGSD